MIALNRKSIIAVALLGSMVVAASASAGIKNTPHNLSSDALNVANNNAGLGANPVNAMAATAEICVFCHTPHGAGTDTQAPLWNKTLPNTTYTVYDAERSSTIDGTVDLDGSVSLACLSCHDGTQAMDVMINTPGRLTDPSSFTGVMIGGTATDGSLSSGTTNPYANFTSDISNDHPVGIQYAGGGYEATLTDGNLVIDGTDGLGDADFVAPETKMINSAPVWWLDTEGVVGPTGGNGTREKTDIQLYSRVASGTTYAGIEPFVECASCHDPHSSTTKTFLRVSNDESRVCLACHDK